MLTQAPEKTPKLLILTSVIIALNKHLLFMLTNKIAANTDCREEIQ